VVEVSTDVPELFFGFFLFCMNVVRHVEDLDAGYAEALEKSLAEFGKLLTHRPLLSLPAVLGLFGELWLLGELIIRRGVGAFSSWLGPMGERHDFRLGSFEVEAKTTTKDSRTHVINGLEQLVPSPGRTLFILSLKLERAGQGAGETLPGRVRAIRSLLRSSSDALAKLDSCLSGLGFHDQDAERYPDRFSFRDRAVLVPVDESCPSLTRHLIREHLGGPVCDRLIDAEYVVNLDGLGFAEGSPEFDRVLPGVQTGGVA
jgi:hypothetical protein